MPVAVAGGDALVTDGFGGEALLLIVAFGAVVAWAELVARARAVKPVAQAGVIFALWVEGGIVALHYVVDQAGQGHAFAGAVRRAVVSVAGSEGAQDAAVGAVLRGSGDAVCI